VAVICSATPAEYRQLRKSPVQLPVQLAKLRRVAHIEFRRLIEFRVAAPGRIRPHGPDA